MFAGRLVVSVYIALSLIFFRDVDFNGDASVVWPGGVDKNVSRSVEIVECLVQSF